MRKFLCFSVIFILIFSMAIGIFATEKVDPTILLETKQENEILTLTLVIKNNPGISSLKLNVQFDKDLTLNNIKYNEDLAGVVFNPGDNYFPRKSSTILNWVSLEEVKGDFTFATLTFKLNTKYVSGNHTFNVTYDEEDIFDKDLNNISFVVAGQTFELTPKETTTAEVSIETTTIEVSVETTNIETTEETTTIEIPIYTTYIEETSWVETFVESTSYVETVPIYTTEIITTEKISTQEITTEEVTTEEVITTAEEVCTTTEEMIITDEITSYEVYHTVREILVETTIPIEDETTSTIEIIESEKEGTTNIQYVTTDKIIEITNIEDADIEKTGVVTKETISQKTNINLLILISIICGATIIFVIVILVVCKIKRNKKY